MSMRFEIPDHWSFHYDEISAGVYKVIASARDGRRIEATGFDGDRLARDVETSIKDSDAQIEKLIERRRLETVDSRTKTQ